jgi:hypothetical protein
VARPTRRLAQALQIVGGQRPGGVTGAQLSERGPPTPAARTPPARAPARRSQSLACRDSPTRCIGRRARSLPALSERRPARNRRPPRAANGRCQPGPLPGATVIAHRGKACFRGLASWPRTDRWTFIESVASSGAAPSPRSRGAGAAWWQSAGERAGPSPRRLPR